MYKDAQIQRFCMIEIQFFQGTTYILKKLNCAQNLKHTEAVFRCSVSQKGKGK